MEEDFPFYRITDINNVPLLLRDGLWSMSSGRQDDGYVFIGDSGLVSRRASIDVPVPPGGTLADYVPCYFGARSPMLYNIQHSKGPSVRKRSAAEIVYLCFRRHVLDEQGLRWCFTDGHAKERLTKFYTSASPLTVLDAQAIGAQDWGSPQVMEHDRDLRRRKQAELLVHSHIPAAAILHILTADEASGDIVKQFVLDLKLPISVSVAPYRQFYY